MLKYLIIVSFLFTPCTYALKLVHVEQKVVIERSIEDVCGFVSNPLNDKRWRMEVNHIEADGDEKTVGTIFTEDAFIALIKNFITKTTLVKYDCPHEAVFVTTDDNPFYLKSMRCFKALPNGKTQFHYLVDFDERMIKETIGLRVKPRIVKVLYESKMKNYMKKLKRLMED